MKFYIHLFALLFLFQSCQSDKKETTPDYLRVEGKTMGTYYRVTYQDSLGRDFSRPIDSLLVKINSEINTYESNSTVTRFNNSEELVMDLGTNFKAYSDCLKYPKMCDVVQNKHIYANFLIAKVAHERTRHAFDPTVMSLVNYWGFGYTPKKPVNQVDSMKIDSLMNYVGFEKVKMIDRNGFAALQKSSPEVKIDFGGTGQGYGIDEVGIFLETKGIKNYLVDIGGECRARGKNPDNKWWTAGINTPKSDAAVTDFTRMVKLENLSVSTSGNYRNFHEVDGKKYSHFISPITGFPGKSNLLSASVFGKDCTFPDAMATGFMLLEVDEAYKLATQLEDIEALFIYSDENGGLQVKYTEGVEQYLINDEF